MGESIGSIFKRAKQTEKLVISKRIDTWLMQHPEGITVPPEMMPLIESLLSSPNADRSARFGASGRGSCLRQQTFSFLGMPSQPRYDSVLQNIFNDGTWRHIRWQVMGLLAGVFVNDTWDVPNGIYGLPEDAPVEVVHVLPEYNLKVSVDADNPIEGWGFELKGSSAFGKIVKEGVPPNHLLQIHTYFLATGYDRFLYVVEDKMRNDWHEIVVDRDESIMRLVKDELNALTDAVEDRTLPPVEPACRTASGPQFQQCPYRATCIAQRDIWPVGGQWASTVQAG